MRGIPNFASGFMQGYGFVDDVKRRNQAAERRQMLDEREQARYQDTLEYREEKQDWREQRAETEDARWEKGFEADQAHRQASSERAERGLELRETALEIEQAEAARQRREQENLRNLRAGLSLWEAGDKKQARKYLKQGGIDVDQMATPEWQDGFQHLKTLASGEGRLTDPKTAESFNTVFKDRIEESVGKKLPNGDEIVGVRAGQIVPARSEGKLAVNLRVTAKNKKGKTYEYDAPLTPLRSPEDRYVMEIDLDKALGKMAAMDRLNEDVIKAELIRAGGAEAGDSEWARGPGNTIFRRDTGETRDIPVISDAEERRETAAKMANDALMENRQYTSATPEKQARMLSDMTERVYGVLTSKAQDGGGGNGDGGAKLTGQPAPQGLTEGETFRHKATGQVYRVVDGKLQAVEAN